MLIVLKGILGSIRKPSGFQVAPPSVVLNRFSGPRKSEKVT
jgi:hypothetical protein